MTELFEVGLCWLRRPQSLEFGVRTNCCSDIVTIGQSFDKNMESIRPVAPVIKMSSPAIDQYADVSVWRSFI